MGKKKKLSKKDKAINDLASQVIFWQKAFNQSIRDLEQIDGQKRYKCKVEKHQDIINRAFGKNRDDE